MTNNEFVAWVKFGYLRRGLWTIDQVHDGSSTKDLLIYRSYPDDQTAGIFFRITTNGQFHAGRYTGALPHIGEASFSTKTFKKFASKNEAIKYAIESVGIRFLMEIYPNWSK